MSARDSLVEAAHRAFYLAKMGHEMPDGIEIDPGHDRALTAAVVVVEAVVRERIALAIESELVEAERAEPSTLAGSWQYQDGVARARVIARGGDA